MIVYPFSFLTEISFPSCLDSLELTSGGTGDGIYNFIGYGYLDIQNIPILNIITGSAPDGNNYALYQKGSTEYVIKTFSDITEYEWNYYDSSLPSATFYGAFSDDVISGYNIPLAGTYLDFTVSYPNCP